MNQSIQGLACESSVTSLIMKNKHPLGMSEDAVAGQYTHRECHRRGEKQLAHLE